MHKSVLNLGKKNASCCIFNKIPAKLLSQLTLLQAAQNYYSAYTTFKKHQNQIE